MFIHTEVTPNPATLKFLPGKTVLPEGTLDIRSPHAAERSPLAAALFGIEGVEGVFYGSEFVSVTKSDAADWQVLKPAVLGTIMEHFTSGAPLLLDDGDDLVGAEQDEFFAPDDAEIVDTIKDLLETRVRPAVAGDGGDIKFRGFREGTVYLAMKGSCQGCPSSTATLKHGIQNLLQHFVPEVQNVEQV
jgi:Fe-S cluster biogenesis protein NfuA